MMTIPKALKPIKPKDEWHLSAFTYGPEWAFNLLEYSIINEQFCRGTELALDDLYQMRFKEERNWGSDMALHFYKDPPNDFISTWEFLHEDPNYPDAGIYLDTASGKELWLCPLWTKMWGGFPTTLYLEIT
jgi:hypothetical protein